MHCRNRGHYQQIAIRLRELFLFDLIEFKANDFNFLQERFVALLCELPLELFQLWCLESEKRKEVPAFSFSESFIRARGTLLVVLIFVCMSFKYYYL